MSGRNVPQLFHTRLAEHEDAELLPKRLAGALKAALGVDGAGVSVLSSQFRVPLAASDDDAARAERLQFTLGEGPCLEGLQEHRVVRADPEYMAAHWPAFHAELTARSRYRAIVSAPLDIAPNLPGALDLYLHDPTRVAEVDPAEVSAIAAEAGRALGGALTNPTGSAWLRAVSARERLTVWVAMGVVIEQLGATVDDSKAILRAYAFAHDKDVDEVASLVVNGTLPAVDLTR